MKVHTLTEGPAAVPGGCRFAAIASGVKPSGSLDLAFAQFDSGATAAAVFTSNRVVAAPILVAREHLRRSRGRIACLLVNSGNANCATGPAGLRSCQTICRALGSRLEVPADLVFPSSTGIIGVPLPEEKIITALPRLLSSPQATSEGFVQFARAIMTTDTRPKLASVQLRCDGRSITLAGVAKGAGMIHPQLATLLVYVFTDIQASAAELQSLLRPCCNETFNCISVDGDTSTNDTVLLVATATSGCRLREPGLRPRFAEALSAVCDSLAEQIVRDGEGVKHQVTLHIEQARNQAEAQQVARTLAHSLLVKTAWAGADPNWGRILAAIGRSRVPVDPARINIFLGPHHVCRRGVRGEFDEGLAHDYLSQPAYSIRVQLGRGRARTRFLTADLTAEYVHINADYST